MNHTKMDILVAQHENHKISTMGQTTLNLEPLENSDSQLFGSGVRMNHTKMDILVAQHENHENWHYWLNHLEFRAL